MDNTFKEDRDSVESLNVAKIEETCVTEQTLNLSFIANDVEEIRDSVESLKSAKIEMRLSDDDVATSISFEPSYDVVSVVHVKRTKS